MKPGIEQTAQEGIAVCVDLEKSVSGVSITLSCPFAEKVCIGGDLDPAVTYTVVEDDLSFFEHLSAIEIDKRSGAVGINVQEYPAIYRARLIFRGDFVAQGIGQRKVQAHIVPLHQGAGIDRCEAEANRAALREVLLFLINRNVDQDQDECQYNKVSIQMLSRIALRIFSKYICTIEPIYNNTINISDIII